ncbi:MAG: DUF4358 domain-containing protein [Oscillospiraceae bacterium]|nr:DUF4358 domain-containing protein [Oscillospiraceae bacterium]
MKFLKISIALILLITIFASCAGEKESTAVPSAIMAKIIGAVIPEKEVVDKMVYLEDGLLYNSDASEEDGRLSEGQISIFFGKLDGTNDFDVVESYSFWTSMEGVSTEMGIFKVGDITDTEKVVNFLKERVKTLENNAHGYKPEELQKAKNAVVETKGKYVYYFVTNINNVLVDTLKAEIEVNYVS